MLVEFGFKNFRSFKGEAVLSLEATGIAALKNCLIQNYPNVKLVPAVAIYGKNGGGKSNVLRAFWVSVQFICNAQRMQHENAEIPVNPFALDEYSKEEPTIFEFQYIYNNVKYWYGFGATKERITQEYLYHAPKGQKALVFKREGQKFTFTEEKIKRKLIAELIAENQLFFSVACTMNDNECAAAMKWFREHVFFSRDYSDIPKNIIDHNGNPGMLTAISNYAKTADLGITDIKFNIDGCEINENSVDLQRHVTDFVKKLSDYSLDKDTDINLCIIKTKLLHQGVGKDGNVKSYELDLADESDGTVKLMSLAPYIEAALQCGGILMVDELDRQLHPALVNFIISKFQSKTTNSNGAQLVFTTHNTELLNMELLRKDQLYFADKSDEDGASELYSISEFGTRTTDNIRKGYLVGKYGAVPNVDIEEVD